MGHLGRHDDEKHVRKRLEIQSTNRRLAGGRRQGYEPHVPGGELLHAPDNFKKIEKKHSDDFYSSPPFKELNPLLRSYRIAHSYSEDSLQQMGL